MITNIHELIDACAKEMKCMDYSDICIQRHLFHWKNGLVSYMTGIGTVDFSPDVGRRYLEQLHPYHGTTQAASTKRSYRRSIWILINFQESGKIMLRPVPLKPITLNGEIGEAANKMLESLSTENQWANSTFKQHRNTLSNFVAGLYAKGVNRLADIRLEHVSSFIGEAHGSSKKERYSVVCHFSDYLNKIGLISLDLREGLGHLSKHIREKIPSVYSPEEVAKMEKSIEQSSAVGKRDYAIFMLAARLGLRASDIYSMRWDNIDWDSSKIVLYQHKTKQPIELPLLTDVGEALVTYARDARPKSNQAEIFLTCHAPYRALTTISVNGIISRIILGSGVDVNQRRFGTHSLRHTLASNMLKAGSGLPTISSVLGHESTETTMAYLRIDTDKLRELALDVPLVGENFYKEEGGAFYV